MASSGCFGNARRIEEEFNLGISKVNLIGLNAHEFPYDNQGFRNGSEDCKEETT